MVSKRAQPKTRLTGSPVPRFLATVPDTLRGDCQTVADLMQMATNAPAEMWGTSIVGFGRRVSTYADGRKAEWMEAAFAPRKGNITLYLNTGFDGSEALLAKLGPHTMGKSCLHIKRLSDVSLPVLEKLVAESVRHTRKTQAR